MSNNSWFFSLVYHLWHICQKLVAVCVEEHETLVKVVMLHRWGRIQAGQAVAGLDLVTVVGSWNHEIETIYVLLIIKWHIFFSYLCGQGRGRGKQWLGKDTQSLRAASTYYYHYFISILLYSSLLVIITLTRWCWLWWRTWADTHWRRVSSYGKSHSGNFSSLSKAIWKQTFNPFWPVLQKYGVYEFTWVKILPIFA